MVAAASDFLLAFCYLSKLASDRSYSEKYRTRFSIMGLFFS